VSHVGLAILRHKTNVHQMAEDPCVISLDETRKSSYIYGVGLSL